jgi:quinol monooxygenase YgiN
MRLFILARYHARAGHESAVEAALRDVTGPTREERGCLSETPTFPVFRPGDGLPHTLRFLEHVRQVIDHSLDVTRARMII